MARAAVRGTRERSSPLTSMRLLRIPEPFDSDEWFFEPKMDGFRALAQLKGHHCTLISRNGHRFKSWPQLAEEICSVWPASTTSKALSASGWMVATAPIHARPRG
jgi:hypothetical protein